MGRESDFDAIFVITLSFGWCTRFYDKEVFDATQKSLPD